MENVKVSAKKNIGICTSLEHNLIDYVPSNIVMKIIKQ